MDDFCPIVPVDPMYRAVYADGSVLHVRHGRHAMTEEIERFAGPAEAEAFGRFADWLGELYRAEMDDFIDANFDSPLDLMRAWRAGLRLIRLGGFGKLGPKVASFFRDERLQRIFSFQAMYAGLAPYEALALYGVITYMDSIEGVYVPRAVCTAWPPASPRRSRRPMSRCGTRATSAGSSAALVGGSGGRARHRRGRRGRRRRRQPRSPRRLPRAPRRPSRTRVARKGVYSPSCLLWVAGVRGLPPTDAAHHNIHFGHSWDESFRSIIHDGVRMADPSFLVTLHSLDDPTLAPEGCTSIYALEPVPNLDGKVNWKRDREAITAALRARRGAGYPIEVVTERVYDPEDWKAMGMERGTPFALSHTFLQTGPFRPANRDKRVPGLFFTGSSTLPGVGVPMVLVSGKLAAERVRALREWSSMVTLEASYEECSAAEQAERHHVLLGDQCPADGQASPCPCVVRVLSVRRRHRRRPRTRARRTAGPRPAGLR